MNRSTTVRDRHRRAIARGKPPCAICGNPIDYDAHHHDPLSFTVDHIIPWSKGGADTLDNKQPAHRGCNRAKSDKVPGSEAVGGRVYETERTW